MGLNAIPYPPSNGSRRLTAQGLGSSGMIFDIQRFSVHDGPGIRTTIFLKGCPLRCFWCHNPEGIDKRPAVQFYPSRCINCGACVNACLNGAQRWQNGTRVYERERCTACGRCVETCFAEALVLSGRQLTVEQVMEEALRDRAFYVSSGGGVTLSGGEPVMQSRFARAVLERCKREGLHTAIETAGYCRWDALAALLPVTDLVMMDVKHLDPARHLAATGVSNAPILDNARRLARTDRPIVFRVPIVPSVNNTPEAIDAIASFVRSLMEVRERDNRGVGSAEMRLELLQFHRLAADKYRSLGLDYGAGGINPPARDELMKLEDLARAHGVVVQSR